MIESEFHDPATYQQSEELREHERFLAALKEGIKDLEHNVRPAEDVFRDINAKYSFWRSERCDLLVAVHREKALKLP